MKTVSEIDEIIKRMNPSKETLRNNSVRLAFLYYLYGYIAGRDTVECKIKTSVPGESDWIHAMLGFREQQKTILSRLNVWLLQHDIETIKFSG
jgi:hypothetical protein